MTTDAGCKIVLTAVTWFEALALISNSSLFLFRVLAVFADDNIGRIIFTALWLTTFLALSIPFSVVVDFEPLACTISQVRPLGSAGFLAVTMFDTLVFVAITYDLLAINWHGSHRNRLTRISLLFGQGMGKVSKVLLRTGQVYYA